MVQPLRRREGGSGPACRRLRAGSNGSKRVDAPVIQWTAENPVCDDALRVLEELVDGDPTFRPTQGWPPSLSTKRAHKLTEVPSMSRLSPTRGRKSATVEFLERLVQFAGSRREFCDRTGIQPSNLADYLHRKKPVSWKLIETATAKLYTESPPAFIPLVEGHNLHIHPGTAGVLPAGPGLYALFDSAMRLVYFGKASNLRAEVSQTLRRRVAAVRPWTGARNLTFRGIATFLSAYEIAGGDADFRHDVEALGLRLFVNNTFNTNGARFIRTS